MDALLLVESDMLGSDGEVPVEEVLAAADATVAGADDGGLSVGEGVAGEVS